MQRINRYHKSPPHLYLLSAVTRGDPAPVAQTPSVIGRLGEGAIPVWSTWSSVIGELSLERRYGEPTTQQCGRRRAKTRGIVRFSRTARWVGAMRVGEAALNQDRVSKTRTERGHKLARKQRRGGYLLPTKTLSHIGIPNP